MLSVPIGVTSTTCSAGVSRRLKARRTRLLAMKFMISAASERVADTVRVSEWRESTWSADEILTLYGVAERGCLTSDGKRCHLGTVHPT